MIRLLPKLAVVVVSMSVLLAGCGDAGEAPSLASRGQSLGATPTLTPQVSGTANRLDAVSVVNARVAWHRGSRGQELERARIVQDHGLIERHSHRVASRGIGGAGERSAKDDPGRSPIDVDRQGLGLQALRLTGQRVLSFPPAARVDAGLKRRRKALNPVPVHEELDLPGNEARRQDRDVETTIRPHGIRQ
jgi:hypothetical protein